MYADLSSDLTIIQPIEITVGKKEVTLNNIQCGVGESRISSKIELFPEINNSKVLVAVATAAAEAVLTNLKYY